MSETLKFGNGQWAVKKGSTLAYNDENGNYKPLPFTFDRSTSATRVNKQGLIEVVSNNEPRIDFLNDSKGALLLEPTRSNNITYSDLQSQGVWFSGSAWTVSDNSQISPQGILNASSLTEDLTNGFHSGYYNSVIDNGYTGDYTISCFAKYNGRYLALSPKSATERTIFDLQNGSIYQLGGGGVTAKIDNYGNGWYRCSVTCSFSNETVNFEHLLANNNSLQYQGDGVSGIYIYGCQAEQGYLTSYIPTQGSIGTRVAESCNGAGNDQVINSSEGVLYYESKVHSLIGDKAISVSTGSYNDSVSIGVYGGVFQSRIRQGGNFIHFISPSGVNLLDNNKIAIMYSQSNIKIFVNGSLKSTVSGVTYSVNLRKVSFTRADITDKYYGLIKDLRVYNKALTDQELKDLTKI